MKTIRKLTFILLCAGQVIAARAVQIHNLARAGRGVIPDYTDSGPLATADQVTTQITALATALGNDPLRIYEWVLNNIEFEPYFGIRRGAQMTLLDRRGNDWDQSALLGALLKAANYAPVYQYAECEMPVSEACNLYGMTVDNLATALGFTDTSESDPTIYFPRVFVTVAVSGQNAVLDPAFKQYTNAIGTPQQPINWFFTESCG